MKQLLSVLLFLHSAAAIDVTIDITSGLKPVSPALYGKNNCLNINSWDQTTEADKQLYRDAGVRLMRENGGNNGSKYHWRNRLSSHPDWYNNVYINDWDTQAVMIENEFDNVQGMFGFPLVGWAAKTNSCNYDEQTHDPNNTKTKENLCADGAYEKYLTPWPEDSVIGILDHWFGNGGLGLSKENFIYWNLDNEPEIWNGTHDDVFPNKVHPDTVINRYITIAKKIKAINPSIKLCGPAFTNEWQWWAWAREELNGTPWIEYFVKRFGEASKAEGVQLIDMIDYHFYGDYEQSAKGNTEFLQYHRIWYDETYAYPHANGVKTSEGGWDESLNKEYVLKRTEAWIDQYFPEGNTVTLGVSETGLHGSITPDPNYIALWYASQLGTFADHGTELFSPWFWYTGMWEVMHLFSKYHYGTRVESISSNDSLVSAYSAINTTKDTLSIIFANREENREQAVTVELKNGAFQKGTAAVQTLAELPETETFKSASNNALQRSTTDIDTDTQLSLNLKPLSVTRVAIPLKSDMAIKKGALSEVNGPQLLHTKEKLSVSNIAEKSTVRIFNSRGQQLLSTEAQSNSFNTTLAPFSKGVYLLQVAGEKVGVMQRKFVIE